MGKEGEISGLFFGMGGLGVQMEWPWGGGGPPGPVGALHTSLKLTQAHSRADTRGAQAPPLGGFFGGQRLVSSAAAELVLFRYFLYETKFFLPRSVKKIRK